MQLDQTLCCLNLEFRIWNPRFSVAVRSIIYIIYNQDNGFLLNLWCVNY